MQLHSESRTSLYKQTLESLIRVWRQKLINDCLRGLFVPNQGWVISCPGERVPWQLATNCESGAIPQEFGLISSVRAIPLNSAKPRHHQQIKLQKKLKVSEQDEMKGWLKSLTLQTFKWAARSQNRAEPQYMCVQHRGASSPPKPATGDNKPGINWNKGPETNLKTGLNV